MTAFLKDGTATAPPALPRPKSPQYDPYTRAGSARSTRWPETTGCPARSLRQSFVVRRATTESIYRSPNNARGNNDRCLCADQRTPRTARQDDRQLRGEAPWRPGQHAHHLGRHRLRRTLGLPPPRLPALAGLSVRRRRRRLRWRYALSLEVAQSEHRRAVRLVVRRRLRL